MNIRGKEEVVTEERETEPHLQGRHKKENEPSKEASTISTPNPSAKEPKVSLRPYLRRPRKKDLILIDSGDETDAEDSGDGV